MQKGVPVFLKTQFGEDTLFRHICQAELYLRTVRGKGILTRSLIIRPELIQVDWGKVAFLPGFLDKLLRHGDVMRFEVYTHELK